MTTGHAHPQRGGGHIQHLRILTAHRLFINNPSINIITQVNTVWEPASRQYFYEFCLLFWFCQEDFFFHKYRNLAEFYDTQ